jgi:hypothetical protein
MVSVSKVQVDWTGWAGGPGVSSFHFEGGTTPPIGALSSFLSSLRGMWPQSVVAQVRNAGVTIDVATGKPDGAWSGAVQGALVGITAGAYAAPAGACIEWHTGGFLNGHEVKGRTFIVPMLSSQYDTDGTLIAGVVNTAQTAITALLAASPKLVVFSKTHAFSNIVTTGKCLDKVAVLRSRRA